MASALLYDRLQFAVTATFHYLFPQLTMGLALLLFYLKSRALCSGNSHYQDVARFWTKIFALNFAFGVVTGIPLEFQFGTNWAKFSTYAGGVIGQTLAMEGLFAFFSGIVVPGHPSLWRATVFAPRPLACLVTGLPGVLAVRVLHSRHKCLDAASGGLCSGC